MENTKNGNIRDLRCKNCGRKLMEVTGYFHKISVRCHRCRQICVFYGNEEIRKIVKSTNKSADE